MGRRPRTRLAVSRHGRPSGCMAARIFSPACRRSRLERGLVLLLQDAAQAVGPLPRPPGCPRPRTARRVGRAGGDVDETGADQQRRDLVDRVEGTHDRAPLGGKRRQAGRPPTTTVRPRDPTSTPPRCRRAGSPGRARPPRRRDRGRRTVRTRRARRRTTRRRATGARRPSPWRRRQGPRHAAPGRRASPSPERDRRPAHVTAPAHAPGRRQECGAAAAGHVEHATRPRARRRSRQGARRRSRGRSRRPGRTSVRPGRTHLPASLGVVTAHIVGHVATLGSAGCAGKGLPNLSPR